jgi:hypothetical protein
MATATGTDNVKMARDAAAAMQPTKHEPAPAPRTQNGSNLDVRPMNGDLNGATTPRRTPDR